jgi:ribosomal protein S18 acetylase RimI-like enzyme
MADDRVVIYAIEPDLSVDAFIDVLQRSTLSRRRPVDQRQRIARMLERADIVVTARMGSLVVGVSRAISDFSFCTYLSDLAVDVAYQRQGIGKELIARTHEAGGRETMLVLLAAPEAMSYYPAIGMQSHPSCWVVPRTEGSTRGGT